MIDIVERKLDTFLPVLLLIFGAKRVVCKSPYITCVHLAMRSTQTFPGSCLQIWGH